MMKRIFDLAVASLGLVVLLPVALIIAGGVKLSSPGPVIYVTQRVGKRGRVFAHYRFRTMAGEPLQLTRFGRMIGNLSLDEIPALWNVVRGDVSLVGPNCRVPSCAEALGSFVALGSRRLYSRLFA